MDGDEALSRFHIVLQLFDSDLQISVNEKRKCRAMKPRRTGSLLKVTIDFAAGLHISIEICLDSQRSILFIEVHQLFLEERKKTANCSLNVLCRTYLDLSIGLFKFKLKGFV